MSTKSLMLGLSLFILETLVACSTPEIDYGFWDTIPQNATAITKLNLDAVLKKANCKSQSGIITLSTDVSYALSVDSCLLSIVEGAASQGYWIDLSDATIVKMPQGNETFLTTSIKTDRDWRPAIPTTEEKSAYFQEFYSLPLPNASVSLIATEKQAWVVPVAVDRAAAFVDSIMTLARSGAVGDNQFLVDYLSDSHLFKSRISFPTFENPFGDNFNAVYLHGSLSDRIITLQSFCTADNVKVDPLAYLQDIDISVYDGLPPGASAIASIGLGENAITNLPQIFNSNSMKERIAAHLTSEILNPEGGTLSFATAAGGNAETIKKFALDKWLTRLIIPTGEKGEAVTEVLNLFANSDIYLETDDIYVTLWTYDPYDYRSSYNLRSTDIEPDLDKESSIATYVNVPYRSETMRALGLKSGYDFQLLGADSCGSASLRILGPSSYILPALLKDIRNLKLK